MARMATAVTYATDARVGRVIAGYLAAGRHSQRALARHLGVESSAVSLSINGKRRWTLDELFATAEFLDVPISYLIDTDGLNPARMLEVRASRCTVVPLRQAYVGALVDAA